MLNYFYLKYEHGIYFVIGPWWCSTWYWKWLPGKKKKPKKWNSRIGSITSQTLNSDDLMPPSNTFSTQRLLRFLQNVLWLPQWLTMAINQQSGLTKTLRVLEPPFLSTLPPPSCSKLQPVWTPFHFRTIMSLSLPSRICFTNLIYYSPNPLLTQLTSA